MSSSVLLMSLSAESASPSSSSAAASAWSRSVRVVAAVSALSFANRSSRAGTMSANSRSPDERWVSTSKDRMLSTSSPNNSILMGEFSVDGKMSRIPPRRLNSPWRSTMSTRSYPSSTSRRAHAARSRSLDLSIRTRCFARVPGGIVR